MIEYRTERVAPQVEDNVVGILSAFGWVPVSSQELYSESTEITGIEVKEYGTIMQGLTEKDGAINIHQRRNVTNYVTIKFARDTNMPNYDKLRSLNEKFERNLNVPEPKKPVARTAITLIGTLLIVISVILAIAQSNSAEVWEIVVSVVFPVVMIPLTVVGWVKYRRNLHRYNYAQMQLGQIYNEALEIIS